MMSPDTWAKLEAKMLLIAEDYPTANLILIRDPADLPEWSLTIGNGLEGLSEPPPGLDPEEPTVGIAFSAELYDLVGDEDMALIGHRFDAIRSRPVELSSEQHAEFRASAKAAIHESLRRGRGEVWICAAGSPLGQTKPTPFTVQRTEATGDFWIAVPPRWLVADSLGFDMPALMDRLGLEVLAERSTPSVLN